MSDTSRIAHHLRSVGEVSPLDFDGGRPIVDGGKPIKRVAARVKELRDEGWKIVTDQRDGMALYVLVSEPGQDPNPASPERERANFDQTIPPFDVVAQWEAA